MKPSHHPSHYDVIVIGVGSMGAAACYYLARQGARVLGLEQFDIPHELGSHAGQSRIIRKAYFEHPDYVPLLQRAYQNWQKIEAISSQQLYHPSGLLYLGQPDSGLMTSVLATAGLYDIEVAELSHLQAKIRYPKIRIPEGYTALLEPDAGFISPEKAIICYTEQARQLGAQIQSNEKTVSWHLTNTGISVQTEHRHYTADKVVITAGAWAGKLLPDLAPRLSVTRQVIAWVNPKKQAPFALGQFPCWVIALPDQPGIYYGFPMLPADSFSGPTGLKIAYHHPGLVSDPDAVDREVDPAETEQLIRVLDQFMPHTFNGIEAVKTCLYTSTPDEHFIIDLLPGTDKKVVVAAGFSGHGFKFVSVMGEILADLALKGKTELPVGFLGLGRFL
mgnify:CR=1 FL=1